MFKRTLLLSTLVLCLVATTIPWSDSSAKRVEQASITHRGPHTGHHHSRAWWRRRRAYLRRRRAERTRQQNVLASLLRRRRRARTSANRATVAKTLRRRNPALSQFQMETAALRANTSSSGGDARRSLTSGLKLPARWSGASSPVSGEVKFRVGAPEGGLAGTAVLSTVAATASQPSAFASARNARRMLGGVPFSVLRRTVIESMISEGGWVVNDMEREIAGRRVFVVIAHSSNANNRAVPSQTHIFYFTALEGRIYRLAVVAPLEYSDRVAAESEQVLASLHAANDSILAGTTLR